MSTRVVNLQTGETIGYAEEKLAGVVVRLLPGEEIPESEIELHFGLVDWEPIAYVEGEGCYRKIRSFLIRAWRVRK